MGKRSKPKTVYNDHERRQSVGLYPPTVAILEGIREDIRRTMGHDVSNTFVVAWALQHFAQTMEGGGGLPAPAHTPDQ